MSLLTDDIACISRARTALVALFERDRPRYVDLLLRQRPIAIPGTPLHTPDLLGPLEDCGLLVLSGDGECSANFMVPMLRGRPFLTDFPSRLEADSVFPLYPESLYFIELMAPAPGVAALDLCTGSGVYSIFLAEVARRVVAVDVNSRAIELAGFNLQLNGVADRVELLLGDLWAPVEGETFDYIACNPPFEPVPPGIDYYWHSDGGPDGLRIVRRVLAGLPAALNAEGLAQIVTFTIVGNDGPLLNPCIDALAGAFNVNQVELGPHVAMREFARRFRHSEERMDGWLRDVGVGDNSRLALVLLNLGRGGQATALKGRDRLPEFEWTEPVPPSFW